MRKSLLSRSLVLTAVLAASNISAAESVVNFDWDLTQGEQLDGDWSFTPAGSEACGDYNLDQDKYCTADHRLFLFYAGYDSDHKGWMRYGISTTTSEHSISGSALKMVFTGGRDFDENGVAQDYGAPIKSIEAYKEMLKGNTAELYSDRDLPGQPMVYYKAKNSNATTLGIFPQSNRFIVHTWMPARDDRHARYSRYGPEKVSSPSKTLAWYPFLDSSKSSHYYHHATNRPYGSWMKVEFDGHPTHNNAGPFNDLHSFNQGGRDASGNSVDYFSRIAAFAVRFHGIEDSASPTTILTDEWQKDFVEFENEETIANLGLGFDPEQNAFDVSLEDKYRCGSCKAEYEIRYSFSPITNGNFSNATEITRMENFFVEDDNEDNLMIKPNGGYNAVWGKIFLQAGDANRYLNGEKIYVAVKDVTQRTVEQDPADTEIISTPDGDIQMQRLIKVIDMTYREAPSESGLYIPSNIYAKLQHEKKVPFSYKGIDTNTGVTSEADYAIRANVFSNSGDYELKVDPWKIGEYGLTLKARDLNGLEKDAFVRVNVDGPLCGYNVECDSYVLADFSAGTATLNYSEFGDYYHDDYTNFKDGGLGIVVGENSDFNYQGITGEGVALNGDEVVIVRLKNNGDYALDVQPKISSLVADRPATSTAWRITEKFNLDPGVSHEWSVPVQELAEGRLSKLTVSIGADSQDVVLSSISMLSSSDLACLTCDTELVDFYASGSLHSANQEGWDVILNDAYTGHVEGGMGIIIGSNRDYNYQGIAGNSELPSVFDKLAFHWVNTSDTDYTFTPRYSFEDADRPLSNASGEWFTVAEITVKAGETVIQNVVKPAGVRVINSNVNISQQKDIMLDKIMGVAN